jgi:hypothetical protein
MRIDEWAKFVASIAGDARAEAVLAGGDISKIIALAKSKGFSFNAQDLADANVGELNEKALDRVSGAFSSTGRGAIIH